MTKWVITSEIYPSECGFVTILSDEMLCDYFTYNKGSEKAIECNFENCPMESKRECV